MCKANPSHQREAFLWASLSLLLSLLLLLTGNTIAQSQAPQITSISSGGAIVTNGSTIFAAVSVGSSVTITGSNFGQGGPSGGGYVTMQGSGLVYGGTYQPTNYGNTNTNWQVNSITFSLNLGLFNAGTYQVSVTNSRSGVTSNVVPLQVILVARPAAIAVKPATTSPKAGALVCVAVSVDAFGSAVQNYSGTVNMQVSVPNGAAWPTVEVSSQCSGGQNFAFVLSPGSPGYGYTFTPQVDQGQHIFGFIFDSGSPPSLVIVVTDATNSSLTGSSAAITVDGSASAVNIQVQGGLGVTAGGAAIVPAGKSVQLAAFLANGAGFPATTGGGDNLQLTATDPSMLANGSLIPNGYTFTAGAAGSLTNLAVTPGTAGNVVLSVKDLSQPSLLAGSVSLLVVPSALQFSPPPSSPVTSGVPFQVTVSALDANRQVLPSYQGTVKFSSTDPAALLPPQYTFTPINDKGKHPFPVTLSTLGGEVLFAFDTAYPAAAGQVTELTVNPLVAKVSVPTQRYNNQRTGANTAELVLTVQTVSSPAFQKLYQINVDGQVYAQPLLVSNVLNTNTGLVNDILLVATMNNSLFAFSVDNGLPGSSPSAPQQLWVINFGTPVAANFMPMAGTTDQVCFLPQVCLPSGNNDTPDRFQALPPLGECCTRTAANFNINPSIGILREHVPRAVESSGRRLG